MHLLRNWPVFEVVHVKRLLTAGEFYTIENSKGYMV
jgi:hypothetical protein